MSGKPTRPAAEDRTDRACDAEGALPIPRVLIGWPPGSRYIPRSAEAARESERRIQLERQQELESLEISREEARVEAESARRKKILQ